MAVIIAFVFRELLVVAVFYAAYIPLRSYAGGHHAKTHERCALVSTVILIVLCLWMRFFPEAWYFYATIITVAFSSAVIFILAPVHDPNKSFSPGEKKVFGRRARLIFVAETAVLVLFLVLGMNKIAYIISLSHFILALMLVAGVLKNYRLQHA